MFKWTLYHRPSKEDLLKTNTLFFKIKVFHYFFACVCVKVSVCVCVCTFLCRDQKLTLDAFLNYSLHYTLRRSFSLELKACIPSQLVLGMPCLCLCYRYVTISSQHFYGCWDFELQPLNCTVSASPAEPSPQPHKASLWSKGSKKQGLCSEDMGQLGAHD